MYSFLLIQAENHNEKLQVDSMPLDQLAQKARHQKPLFTHQHQLHARRAVSRSPGIAYVAPGRNPTRYHIRSESTCQTPKQLWTNPLESASARPRIHQRHPRLPYQLLPRSPRWDQPSRLRRLRLPQQAVWFAPWLDKIQAGDSVIWRQPIIRGRGHKGSWSI